MVDTALLLTADSVASLAKVGIASLFKNLGDKANEAQAEYRQTTPDPSQDPVVEKRLECIQRLACIRNRITLWGFEPELQRRVLCLVMEQTINTYQAKNVAVLNIVSVEIDQMEAVLNAEGENLKRRAATRRTVVYVSFACLSLLAGFVTLATIRGINPHMIVPFLGIPPCVIFWSAVGSFAAILYRFTNAGDKDLEDPMRWLFSRPVTGIIMGVISFLVLKGGLLVVPPSPGVSATRQMENTNEVVWLLAFIAGFSDRFSEKTLRTLIGRFGGAQSDELVSMKSSPVSHVLDLLPYPRRSEAEVAPLEKPQLATPDNQVVLGPEREPATNGTGR